MLFAISGVTGRCIGLFIALICASTVTAITAPPMGDRPTQLRMVDARVNLKDSYQRATDARPVALGVGLTLADRQTSAMAAAAIAFKYTLPGLEVKFSTVTGAPASVSNKRGALTAAAPALGSEIIVRDFLLNNGGLYGLSTTDVDDLVVLGDSHGGSSGLRMLRMEQQIDGRPVFQSETRFLLDRDGRLLKSLGLMVPNARLLAPQIDSAYLLSPIEAISRLLTTAGKTANPTAFNIIADNDGRLEIAENDDFVAGSITARQVLFPLAPGLLVPAWSLVVFTEGDADWYALIDAETGDLLWRKNIRNYVSAHDARFRVYVQADGTTPADSPAPQSPNNAVPGAGTQFAEIAPTIVSMHAAMNATASPNGWINDCPGGICTANETQTLGNNVIACLDRTGSAGANVCDTDASSVLDGNGRPTGNADTNLRNRDFLGTTPRDFQTNFLPPPQAGNPEAGQTATGNGSNGTLPIDQFRRGAVTNLFYVVNWYHDQLYNLGFDEAAGNFQEDNFLNGGSGNDRVKADAQDSSGTNNANFTTPADGTSGRMQMFRFTGPTLDRDGDLDADIMIHELTHGTSNRLVGNAAGLNWDPAAGLGEGWSDFYALSLLNNTSSDATNGHYAAGAYLTYKLGGLLDNYVYGIRRFPYTTDNAVNPMTWADVDDVTYDLSGGIATSPLNFTGAGAMEVHNSGEIWALTLWEVRSRVIADPAGANGDVPTGNHTMLQLITDALKMTPIDPSFTDARDAILDADCSTNACANEASIWDGFADRGLGYGARTPYNVSYAYAASHMGIHESFSVPFLDVVDPASDVSIDDSAANFNGAIDPGEALKLTVALTNPWRAASKTITNATATLTTPTSGITIYDNTAAYGAIAPQDTVAASDSFTISIDPSVACGSAIDFTLTTASSLGTTSTAFQLRVGAASGTDPVVTYTTSAAVAIPDNAPRGALQQMNVTDDFEIADLDFRVDSITHPFTGDITALLRSPGDIGIDFVSMIGVMADDEGNGDNISNMVIDDDVSVDATNDMAQAAESAAPFTKSWLPVFNSPWTTLDGFPSPDPLGNLSRFDGASTKGNWSILVSDQFNQDTGTLNSWSMLVTPVHFACSAFTAAADVTGTMTVAPGAYNVGDTITYTVTLTNNGTANHGDNPGNEFVNSLPAELTLVSANATSGTTIATIGTNTVTWDGALTLLGGSVTITITAMINAGTQETTINNQGSIAYDSDNNGTNDTAYLTDDPGVGGTSDPTAFTVSDQIFADGFE